MNGRAINADATGVWMIDTNDGTLLGAIGAGAVAILATLYRGFGKLRRDNQQDGTDVETLRALDAAVLHWRTLYETAWKQVGKERELRELAETRTTAAFSEIENLRGEVASLRREIEHLSATLQHYQSAPGATHP